MKNPPLSAAPVDRLVGPDLPAIAHCRCGKFDLRIKTTGIGPRAKYKRTTITCQSCGLGCVTSSREGGGGGSLQDTIRLWQEIFDLDV